MLRLPIVSSALALTLALAVSGCSDSVDSAYDRIEDTVQKSCERCAPDRGVTVTQCVDFFSIFIADDAKRECLKAVGDRQDSVGPYYDCVNDKAGQYESCMDSAGCNEAATDNCGEILDSINDTCPLPSGDALREIQAC